MCGILGATFPVKNELIYKALTKMEHRGNDEVGIFKSEHITLGHNRLSIIGLEQADFPMFNEDGNICAVVNGEFYQHEKIRNKLEKKGHTFRTKTDSEILVHLYEEYKEDCVHHLIGEFAFLLYDKNKNVLFAARDRFGVKPLYITKHHGEFFFSSEMKGLKELGVPFELEKESVLISAATQYNVPDKTLIKNIKQVLPGEMITIHLQTKEFNARKYWDIDFTEKDVDIKDLEQILIDSVKERMNADVDICCALSGGLDSSFVYGVVNQFKKVDAVTVKFEDQVFDESEIAKRTTDYFGTDLHVVTLKSSDIVEHFQKAVYLSEGLTVNSHLVGKFILSDLIQKNNYKVVLTGEGSDELFTGYPHFKKDLNLNYHSFEQENLVSKGIMNTLEKEHDYVQGFAQKVGYVPEFIRVKSVFGKKVTSLFSDDYVNDFNFNFIPEKMTAKMDLKKLKSFDKANTSAYLWSKIVLSNYILRTLADGTEMAHTVEGRTPFLDHRVWEIAGGLSINEKIKGTIEKKILRDIAKPYITEEVYNKTKQPFITPPLLLKEKQFLYDHIDLMPSFIDRVKLRNTLDTIYQTNPDSPEYEAVLYFIYSLMFFTKQYV
jgi:asparagine synthase (glutamine-hydrolysing)